MFTGIFFDIDGTLIDNSASHTLAWARACRDFGLDLPSAQLQRLLGMGGEQFVDRLVGGSMPELADAQGRHVEEFGEGDQPVITGARDLVLALHGEGKYLGVVTSGGGGAPHRSLSRVLPDRSVLQTIVTRDDVEETKPAPDLMVVALERSGIAAMDAVLIGDTGWDGETAARCGVAFLGVMTGGWTEADLRSAGAVAVYSTVGALLEQLSGSPLA